MTKVISPLIFRSNIFLNYINNIHIKLYNNLNNLNYFKFFQLLLSITYMYKTKINNFKINKKFLYLQCTYTDFYNISIYFNFYKIKSTKYIIYNYNILYNLTMYINYFIKYNLHIYNRLFVWLLVVYKKNIYYNKFYIIKYIKYYIFKYTKYYIKIVKLCDRILKNKYKNLIHTLKSIKLIYSGCLYKGGNKKKTFNYIKGNIPISSVSINIDYINDYIKTYKGVVGIKCWLIF